MVRRLFLIACLLGSCLAAMAQQVGMAAMQGAIMQGAADMMQQMASSMQVDPAAIAQAFHFNMSEEDLSRLIEALMQKNSAANASANRT